MIIVWNKGEQALIDSWLTGRGSAAAYGSPVTVPDGTAPGNFGLGLGTRVGGVGTTKSNVMAQILELGTSTTAGYARAPLARSNAGWPSATLQSGSFQSSAPQQTFTFTANPVPNAATLWFVAGSAVLNADNCLFGADTAAVRSFSNGDTEKVTATMRIS